MVSICLYSDGSKKSEILEARLIEKDIPFTITTAPLANVHEPHLYVYHEDKAYMKSMGFDAPAVNVLSYEKALKWIRRM